MVNRLIINRKIPINRLIRINQLINQNYSRLIKQKISLIKYTILKYHTQKFYKSQDLISSSIQIFVSQVSCQNMVLLHGVPANLTGTGDRPVNVITET